MAALNFESASRLYLVWLLLLSPPSPPSLRLSLRRRLSPILMEVFKGSLSTVVDGNKNKQRYFTAGLTNPNCDRNQNRDHNRDRNHNPHQNSQPNRTTEHNPSPFCPSLAYFLMTRSVATGME